MPPEERLQAEERQAPEPELQEPERLPQEPERLVQAREPLAELPQVRQAAPVESPRAERPWHFPQELVLRLRS